MNKKSMKEYRVWRAMKARCYAPSQTKGNYKEYHIGVCERWKNSFSAFIESETEFPVIAYRNYLLNREAGARTGTLNEIGRCQYALKKYLTRSCTKRTVAPKELIWDFPKEDK